MAETGLLFIPDISGFTNFVNQTEVDHSRYIIQELLEELINSNQLQLQVSEVEGDAILFYRMGEAPSLDEIRSQVETMFCNFHRILKYNAARRICQCSACKQADTLTLKVITHLGAFSTYRVKDFSKLIGSDVITVHHLMKNDIPVHEYWMVTDSFFRQQDQQQLPGKYQWNKGSKLTDTGQVDYFYSLLTPLKEHIEPKGKEQLGIKGKRILVQSFQKEYDADISRLFSVIGDISRRPKWLEGLKEIKNISTNVHHVGTSHHCILDKKIEVMTTSDFYSDDYKIVMEETDKNRMATLQYIFTKVSDDKTLLTMNLLMKNNPFLVAAFKLFMKKKFDRETIQSMENLSAFLKTGEAATCHC